MTVLNTGSSEKYADGWDKIFAGKRRANQSSKKSSARTAGARGQQRKAAKVSVKKKAGRGKKKASGAKSRRR